MSAPKLVMIETPWNEPGNPKFGTSERVGYIHSQNATIVNALNLWNQFYFIDAFVGSDHNRFTKISPSLNSSSEKNKFSLSLKDFKSLVANPKFRDNFGEAVIADSVQWYIEHNGAAEVSFRKKGWLANPQHPNASNRSQEIAVNLKLKLSIPNGQ